VPTTLDDLRDQLFRDAEDLRAKDKPMDVDRAKAISEVAQTFINSAKAEVDFVKAVGMDGAELPVFGAKKALPAPGQPRLVKGNRRAGASKWHSPLPHEGVQ
jgi:hypothetical protein